MNLKTLGRLRASFVTLRSGGKDKDKGKGKEKDVGKRRAYVRVITSLGGGALNLELFCEKVRLGL